jgi:hypothetical protein
MQKEHRSSVSFNQGNPVEKCWAFLFAKGSDVMFKSNEGILIEDKGRKNGNSESD